MREGRDGCRMRSTEGPEASVRRRESLVLTSLSAKRMMVVERKLNRWMGQGRKTRRQSTLVASFMVRRLPKSARGIVPMPTHIREHFDAVHLVRQHRGKTKAMPSRSKKSPGQRFEKNLTEFDSRFEV